MTDQNSLVPLQPRRMDELALMQPWPPSIRRLAEAMGTLTPPEIPEALSPTDHHWISQRLRFLTGGLRDRPDEARKVMAAMTRMFIVYDHRNMSVEAAQLRLQTYLDALGDLDPDVIVAVVDAWIAGTVPNKEAKTRAAMPAAIRELAASAPNPRREEIRLLQRLRSARVVPVRKNDPISLAERRATAERMLRVFSGEEEMPKSRKAVDL